MITENKFEIEKKLIDLFTKQELSNFYYTFDSLFVWLYEKAPLKVTVFKDNLYTSMEFLLMKEESKSKEHLKYNLNIGSTLEKFKNLPEFFMVMKNPVTLYKVGEAALIIMKDAFLLLEKDSCLSTIYSETKEVATKYWRLLEWDKVIEEKEIEYWYLNRSNSRIVPKLLKSPVVEVDINKNYNQDLPFDQIIQFVESNKPGLVLFNGDPGTGKSTLIKHLIALYPEKEWVLVPSIIIRIIGEGDPSSLNYFLSGNKDRIYILEDCEKLIMKREKGNDLEVFLNLTDGMLGDALCPKFICTFNTNVSNIDQALLRRGRLKLRYEFEKLSLDRTRLHLPNATSSMYLSDIYNQLDNGGEVKINKVGFC